MVCEYLYDGQVHPRVTVLTVHNWRHEAIDSARSLAGDATYFVNDAPAAGVAPSSSQIAEFFA